ncbi:MAG: hypothetical protein H6728_03960 [Myxococcales bacterium]|nr:hypothetical protein [Myxococcales bacterium]
MASKDLVPRNKLMLEEAKGMLQNTKQEMEDAMKMLGLTPETLPLITIFPLLYVAWSNDKFDDKQLQVILEVAEEHGMFEGTARDVLSSWLESKPNDRFWKAGLYLMGVFLQGSSDDVKGTILELSERVGHAAGGVLGVAFSIDAKEREALQKISTALGLHNEKARHKVMEAVEAQFSERELSWQDPIQWQWVQLGSIVITVLLAVVLFAQRSFLDAILLKVTPPATPTPSIWMSALVFVVLPALPFVLGGALIGLRSEGDVQREAVLAVVIPVLMYWGISLVFWLLAKSQSWDAQRWIMQATFTAVAIFVTAGSARFTCWLTSHPDGR